MAVTPYIIGDTMPGFRKESFYIEKYGDTIGKQKYQQVLKQRESRSARRSAGEDLVQCHLCNKEFKRITRTHLKHSCIESITTEEYLKRFPAAELVAPTLKKLYSNTKESIVEKYRDELGEEKWQSYCDIQAVTNTFEYKAERFNVSKEQFEDYNKSRAATLKNFIIRHGEEDGLIKWYEYCERQRYTTSIDYFIEKYGGIEGEEKWEEFYLKRINSPCNRVSAEEIEVFNTLLNNGLQLIRQYKIRKGRTFIYDYANIEKKLLIEYNGDVWHMNPEIYCASDIQPRTGCTAQEIWNRDARKQAIAKEDGFTVYTIWAKSWKKSPQQIINDIKHIYENN